MSLIVLRELMIIFYFGTEWKVKPKGKIYVSLERLKMEFLVFNGNVVENGTSKIMKYFLFFNIFLANFLTLIFFYRVTNTQFPFVDFYAHNLQAI